MKMVWLLLNILFNEYSNGWQCHTFATVIYFMMAILFFKNINTIIFIFSSHVGICINSGGIFTIKSGGVLEACIKYIIS